VAERYGGRFVIDSRAGAGTTSTLEMPDAAAEDRENAQE